MDTLISLIDESCRNFAERTAFLHKTGEGWEETSYDRLRRTSDAIAAGLVGKGFPPGANAALMAPSSPLWVAAYLGILKAGGVVVPIDRELKTFELRHILIHGEVTVLFTDGERLEPALALAEELPSLGLIVALDSPVGGKPNDSHSGGAARCTVLPLDALLHEEAFTPVSRRPEDTALILYTSGTTGRSKGAMLSHANIVSNIRAAVAHLKMDETVHTLSFLPINHVFEQVCGILLPLFLGGKVSFCESLKKLGENLTEVRPTFFVGVPAVYRMVFNRVMEKIEGHAVSRLLFSFAPTRPLISSSVRKKLGSGTTFVSGGAALDPAISRGFIRLGVTLYQGYGITETSPVIAVESPDGARPGTVGRVLEGVEVRIDNPNEEGVGEILVRGSNVMQGYFKDPQATEEVLIEGWYRTGDLGRLDGDGFLSICGRAKNLIVTPNGRNVYPEEVEAEILKSPFIAEVVVYGHRTGATAEEIRAVVRPDREALEASVKGKRNEPLSDEEVESVLRGEVFSSCRRLADYKRVRKITIREEEFPKTSTRKVKRFEVEAMRALDRERD